MYFFQELNDIKKSGIKVYRVSPIDEANMLNWQGLIMPVSCQIILLLFPSYWAETAHILSCLNHFKFINLPDKIRFLRKKNTFVLIT